MKYWFFKIIWYVNVLHVCHVRTIKRPSRVLMHWPFHIVMKVVEPATRILIRRIITLASLVITSFLKKRYQQTYVMVIQFLIKFFASKLCFIKSCFIPRCISVLFESHRIWTGCILQQWDRRIRLHYFPCSLDYC